MNTPLFDEWFRLERRTANGIEHNVRHGDEGPLLLLLHGIPQTRAIRHRVAPRLARQYGRYIAQGTPDVLLEHMRACFGDASP